MAGMGETLSSIGSVAGPITSIAGALMARSGAQTSARGYEEAGAAARVSAEYQAAQLNQNAGQSVAAAQRAAAEERHKSRLVQSRALAVAAASGAGASDPTTVNIISDIAAEGHYRGLMDMYAGEDKARLLRAQASGVRYTGAANERAGQISAEGSIIAGDSAMLRGLGYGLSGGSSLFAKYFIPSSGTGSHAMNLGYAPGALANE